MATEFSDIYIDGLNTEELYAGGGQIVEAWLNGECIWKLKDETLAIHSIYTVTHHDEKYYIIFRAGIAKKSANGVTTWNNLLYYIGIGNAQGIISEMETIYVWNNYSSGTNVNAGNYIAVECEKGLFAYYAAGYAVGTRYIFFENYDIGNQKTIITESPFKNVSQTLPTMDVGIWSNAIITNKYIFYCTVNNSGRVCLSITDFLHKEVKRVVENFPMEKGDAQFKYISSDGGNKIYFYYAKGSDMYGLKYGVMDIESLNYWQETLDIEPISQKILDDFFNESVYEKPNLNEVSYRIDNSIAVIALSAGKYIYVAIYFWAECINKNTYRKESVGWGGKYLIDIDNKTYQKFDNINAISPVNLYDLGEKYSLYHELLFYKENEISIEWPEGGYGDNDIKSFFQRGFYTQKQHAYGYEDSYMFAYNQTSCTVSKYPDIKIDIGKE